jgi:NADH-quinone oxidoreductase subunit L
MNSAIVFLPLLGAVLAGLFGRLLGDRGAQLATCVPVTLSAILGWIALFQLAGGRADHSVLVFTWIDSGAFEADWSLRFDALTGVMLAVVGTVSALVHVYSIGYMHGDPGIPRFFSYLSLFTFSMLMLVTADNLLQLFFGWEGVGLCSYLLIGYWYKKPEANAAAIKAFIVNRVGDFGFALGIVGIFLAFGTIDLATIFEAAPSAAGRTFEFLGYQADILTTLCLLLFMGAMGKSAQLGLHTWLPDAMEGPTPVSALIHAATMVTAGVFMVARLSPLFELAPAALEVVAFVGASTAFVTATIGLCQNDIKRVVAYSTCSQLGYMFFACGVSAYAAGIFHLFTHAFFKALLFLGSGSVIHALHGEQDMRKMGGLWRKVPVTYGVMWVGSLALAGVPFFAGYYSKDLILEAAFTAHTPMGRYAFWLGIAAAVMTAFYSWRLLFMTFHGSFRGDPHALEHAHESPPVILVPLILLAAGAAFGGYFGLPMVEGEAFWGESLRGFAAIEAAHHAPTWVQVLPIVAAVVGIGIAWVMYMAVPGLPARLASALRPLYLFLLNKWYFDELYEAVLVRPAKALGYGLWKGGDGAVIDGLGPDGIAAATLDFARRAVKLQSGYVYHYAFAMLVGVVVLVTWYLVAGLG